MFQTGLAQLPGDVFSLYALMTPPAVLSAFLGATKNFTPGQKNRIALKTSCAIFILGSLLYLWGAALFELFAFTLDAFRIGAGALLFLNGCKLMRDEGSSQKIKSEGDISIVPLAVPLGLGPASIGAVMVMGASARDGLEQALGLTALLLAAFLMYILLRLAGPASHMLGKTGVALLSRLTGLLMAAIAAQVIFTGVAGFLS